MIGGSFGCPRFEIWVVAQSLLIFAILAHGLRIVILFYGSGFTALIMPARATQQPRRFPLWVPFSEIANNRETPHFDTAQIGEVTGFRVFVRGDSWRGVFPMLVIAKVGFWLPIIATTRGYRSGGFIDWR